MKYSLHHLTDRQKVDFIHGLLPLLRENGHFYIGDVAFASRADTEACRLHVGDQWDADEIYFVFDEMKRFFPQMQFEPLSPCAGILSLRHSV